MNYRNSNAGWIDFQIKKEILRSRVQRPETIKLKCECSAKNLIQGNECDIRYQHI